MSSEDKFTNEYNRGIDWDIRYDNLIEIQTRISVLLRLDIGDDRTISWIIFSETIIKMIIIWY